MKTTVDRPDPSTTAMTSTNDNYLVQLKLQTRNLRLVDACKQQSITLYHLANMIHVSYPILSRIVNLHTIPSEDLIVDISSALSFPPEYLFPDELLQAIKAGVFVHREKNLSVPEIISLTDATLHQLTNDGELEQVEAETDLKMLIPLVQDALSYLKPMEQKVLSLRYGFDNIITTPNRNDVAKTLQDVGQLLHLSTERVRQYEDDALRAIRKNIKSRNSLRPFSGRVT